MTAPSYDSSVCCRSLCYQILRLAELTIDGLMNVSLYIVFNPDENGDRP